LSVEITLLFPVASVAEEAAKAFVTYAKDLRHSGSDVFVEEVLVEDFGRSKISGRPESSLKSIVQKSSPSISL
jgi:hypothetical protein